MKARPILFSSAMVRSILDGRKTQTRRVIKEPDNGTTTCISDSEAFQTDKYGDWEIRSCPYGNNSGDLLWVRETWGLVAMRSLTHREPISEHVTYRAGRYVMKREDAPPDFDFDNWPKSWGDDYHPTSGRWSPSIHMPRWASRITLEITGVRVERLNDISEADAKAEGAEKYDISGFSDDESQLLDAPLLERENPYRNGFALLWESINGPSSWKENKLVWVIEFKPIMANVDAVLRDRQEAP